MGIRTYINAYKEVPNGEHCMGKTDILQHWLEDNDIYGDLDEGNVMMGDYERKKLVSDITEVLTAKDKRRAFDKKFKESYYYTDYDGWFEDSLETLKDLKEWLLSLDEDVVLYAGQW